MAQLYFIAPHKAAHTIDMKQQRHILFNGVLVAAVLAGTGSVAAQVQTTGEPGTPDATTTIDGRRLPPPGPEFRGVIRPNAIGSTPWWAPRVVPRKGAPNVLLIMTDDVGFGAPSTFGGVIPTPVLDRIADNGLRYTRFHSTSLCSPSRAALLTGRNHHNVGNGEVIELSNGYPGYNGSIPNNVATIGRILKEHGYATSWFGKNHNTPAFQKSQTGPFDLWPTGMGFDYFYGFMGGDTSQWRPGNLFRNTTPIYPYEDEPKLDGEQWNLTTAMANEAIDWLNQLNQIDPDKPFFCYYVPGGTHSPHHPTSDWIEEISKKNLFKDGWNKLRNTIYENQLELGVLPDRKTAKLTAWPKKGTVPDWANLPEWDTLGPAEKKLFIRQAEIYAAYLAYTDEQIGRVIDAVEQMGKLDNTLVIYISGDNGASVEGTLNGSPNEVLFFNQKELCVERQLPFISKWGSDETYPHMAAPWAWAFDTPFKWTKQVASHFGGTRQGMCISWPRGIETDIQGGTRDQFHHLIDIAPTILEAVGVEAPKVVDGIAQKDMDGVSMAYTFSKQVADAPSKRKTQYFEEQGLHGIYHEGWYACTTPVRAPWSVDLKLREIELNPAFGYDWELYNLNDDWTQANDLLASEPDNPEVKAKLEQLQRLFMQEARKYQVLPLDANTAKLLKNTPRPSITGDRTEFVYTHTMTGVPLAACAPNVLKTSFTITAEIEVPKVGRREGVLTAQGGRFAGWSLYLLRGTPVFTWNRYGLTWVRCVGNEKLEPGRHKIVFDFQLNRTGSHGTCALMVDRNEPVIKEMVETIPTTMQWDESFDIGSDIVTSVCPQDYTSPFEFTGAIRKIKIELGEQDSREPVTYRELMQDILIEADYWTSKPCILAAGLGFTDINGTVGVALPQQEQAIAAVRRNGGAWNTIYSAVDPDDVPLRAYTSAISPLGMKLGFGVGAPNTEGTPMELSWPVLPSTLHPDDILITLNNGEKKHPVSISIMPNFEYNERTTLVMNGDCFGNRLDPRQPGAIYPVKFEIVNDGTPLKLVGPHGHIVSAVGLCYETGQPLTAYGEGNGPRLCAAKLTCMADGLRGEGGPPFFGGNLPNDGVSLYGHDAQYRLRMLTTGGFSPDGVRSLYPDEFENFFRLRVLADDEPSSVIWIEKSGRSYTIGRHGTIEVVGLADLGQCREKYDDTYVEDHDNQIDIILKGDEAAMRRIVAVHIPAKHRYRFYNPGGPGNNPFRGVTYSAAGPEWLQPVTVAIDDPMQVTYQQ